MALHIGLTPMKLRVNARFAIFETPEDKQLPIWLIQLHRSPMSNYFSL